jgi:hypothetical protein
MAALMLGILGVGSFVIAGASAASFPPALESLDVEVIDSKIFAGASISYKEVRGN